MREYFPLATFGILFSFFISDNKKRNLVIGLILSFFLLFSSFFFKQRVNYFWTEFNTTHV
ncbi:MAG: hypothetical protein JETT_2512 [Candidatus Jettenia ecosi]|uniref:Uncharacterized protein n=1 Tax=Candidatus Jettenia ecosi TaxID=2494326 RepID=A0A533Q955_9BACT|nr:MAG: hypothetical protein JETT_2512 [Candidatus Jettenia ecosi]